MVGEKVFTDLKKKDIKYNIYTDLDTLFDTRLAVAMRLDMFTTADALENRTYYERTSEQIGLIPDSVIRLYYDIRGEDHILLALPTYIPGLILQDYFTGVENAKTVGFIEEPVIYINTYPYILEENELDRVVDLFTSPLGEVKVEFLYKSNINLDPNWLKDNVCSMYKYDFVQWINYHMGLGHIDVNTLAYISSYFPLLAKPSVTITTDLLEVTSGFFNAVTQAFPLKIKMFCAMLTDEERDKTLKELMEATPIEDSPLPIIQQTDDSNKEMLEEFRKQKYEARRRVQQENQN